MKKKIAQIITRMIAGGASRIVIDLINAGRQEFDTTLITGIEGYPASLEKEIPGTLIRVLPRLGREISPLRDLRSLAALYRLFRTERFDIVHTHTSKAGFVGRIAARWAQVPRIVHTPHGTIHLPNSNIPGIPSMLPVQRTLLALERAAGRRTNMLVALSQVERDHYVQQNVISSSRSTVIYNGIHVARYAPDAQRRLVARETLAIGDTEVLIVSAGRLAAEKRHDVLVKGFLSLATTFPRVRLTIAGAGPEKHRLESLLDASPHGQRATFPGYVDDMPSLLSAADIFVLPSMYEGFGLAALEAMAAGLPVVASNVGGLPELIRPGIDGELVTPGSVEALTAALRGLLASPERRVHLGKEAQVRAGQFSREKMIHQYYELYKSV